MIKIKHCEIESLVPSLIYYLPVYFSGEYMAFIDLCILKKVRLIYLN